MVVSIKKEKRKGWLVYVAAILFLLSGLFLFISPFCSYEIETGRTINLTPYKVLLGGSDSFTVNGYVYSFSYSINVPLLILEQLFILSFFSCLFGKRVKRNIIVGLIIGSICLCLDCFCLSLVCFSSKGIIYSGVKYGPGFYFSIILCLFALIILLFCLIPISFNKKELDDEA